MTNVDITLPGGSAPITRSPLANRLELARRSSIDPTSKSIVNELDKISREIGWYEEEARKAFALALQYKLEIGRRLARAKELAPHGTFLSWAHANFGWTPRHVQNHLILARNAKCISHLPAGTSMAMALAAIKEMRLEPARMATEVPHQLSRICLIGEIEEGILDRQMLLKEMTLIAAKFGAPKTRWRVR